MTGAKMRVYEIAKEVGIPNKDLIAKIRALGLEVNNHMSSLDADDVARIKRSLEKEKQGVAQPQQTKVLSTGTVLRRRSSADKGIGGDADPSVERTPVSATASSAPAAPPGDHVLRRRRVVSEDAAPAATQTPAPRAPVAAAASPAVVARRPAAPSTPSAPPSVVDETPAPPAPAAARAHLERTPAP